MVLGHSGCGAVDAAIKRLKDKAVLPGHLPALIGVIKPAVVAAEKMTVGNLFDNSIAENVRRQVAQLKSAGPIVQKSYEGRRSTSSARSTTFPRVRSCSSKATGERRGSA